MFNTTMWLLAAGSCTLAPTTRPPAICTRGAAVRAAAVAAASTALPLPCAVAGAPSTSTDPLLRELNARLVDPSPKQQSAGFGALAAGLGRTDSLAFPPWMEGRWAVTSNPVATAAPLGRRFLPSDLARMRLGDLSDLGAPPLSYQVQFVRRDDGAVVSDRVTNLVAVQDAAAGYTRVETASFDGVGKISVSYSPFGRNGTFVGPSRAEVYLSYRKQSRPSGAATEFAFAEATRTVFLAQRRELSTISDAETLCRFEQVSDGEVRCRQRVLRFLTPNPNSAEGVLWGEANGRAVALLDYDLRLVRVGDAQSV